MKSTIALLLLCAALALAAPCAVGEAPEGPSAAEEAAPSAGFSESEAGYAGVWVPFDDGFRLYLPDGWQSFEITGAQSEAGLFYRAGNGGADDLVGDIPMGVAVSYMKSGELNTQEDLAQALGRAGAEAVEATSLNGIPAVRFLRPEDDYRGAMFFHPEYPDYVLCVYVTPVGEAGTAPFAVGSAILASTSPWAAEPGE